MATKHILWWAAALGAWAYAMSNWVPEVIANAASFGAWAVWTVADATNNAVAWVLSSTWVVPGVLANAFLPTAAGAGAWYYLSNKLANWTGNSESKLWTFMKIAGTAAGAGAWIATESIALPIILASAWLIAFKDVPLWALWKAGQGVSSIIWAPIWFTWWALKWGFKWAFTNTKDKWNNIWLKPNVGF